MKTWITALLIAACTIAGNDLANAEEMDRMSFRFIGSLLTISTNSYLNVHGEEWPMGITIETMLEGKYHTNILWVGTTHPTNPPLKYGIKYEIKAGWGRHGMMLLETKPIEK